MFRQICFSDSGEIDTKHIKVFKTEAHILSFVVLNIFITPLDNICLNTYFTNKSTHLNLHLYFRNQRNDRTFILVL